MESCQTRTCATAACVTSQVSSNQRYINQFEVIRLEFRAAAYLLPFWFSGARLVIFHRRCGGTKKTASPHTAAIIMEVKVLAGDESRFRKKPAGNTPSSAASK